MAIIGLKDIKIKTRLLLWVGAIVCFSFILTIFAVTQKSSVTAQNSAEETTRETAYHYAMYIEHELDLGMVTARSLAQTFLALKTSNKADRNTLDKILKDSAMANNQYVAIWTCWEPNALDGKDAEYIGKPGSDATGRYIPYWKNDGTVEPLTGYDTPGAGDYYLLAKQLRRETILEPYKYTVSGEEVLVTSLVVPILEQDKVLGVVGIDISLGNLSKTVAGIKPFETGYGVLFSNDGIIAAFDDKEKVGKDYGNTSELNKNREDIKNGKEFSKSGQSTLKNANVYSYFVPVHIGKTETPWSFAVAVPIDKVHASANAIKTFAIIIAVVSLVAVLIVLYFVANGITKPIKNTTELLRDIAEGDGDLTKRLAIRSNDEIGLMSKYINQFIENTQNIIKIIAEHAESLAASTQEMSASTQQISSGAQEQASHVETVHQNIDRMVGMVLKGSELAQDAAQKAHETNNKALAGAVKVQTVTEKMEKINEAVEKVSGNSQKIGGILDVIDEIADQTNLLSLNAAIEAARAGEHGRGFAVVAEEVRKLAERSSSSTKEITKLVSVIQEDNIKAVEAVVEGMKVTRATGEAFEEIKVVAGQTNVIIEESALAAKQAAQSGQEVSRAAQEIAAVTEESSAVVEEMAASSEEVAARSQDLGVLVGRFKTV